MIANQYRPARSHRRAGCADALVDRMADDMREMAFAGQNVTAETLQQRGWPAATVARLSARAVERARRRSIRRVEA